MSIQKVLEEFSIEETTNIVILKHLSQALIGVADGIDSEPRAVYSSAACVQQIGSIEGLDFVEALVYFDLNIRAKHAPTGNPMFLDDLGGQDDSDGPDDPDNDPTPVKPINRVEYQAS
jgi:hypothetical protein